jgi:tRNA (guanine-N7-)-methyltransferase
MMAGTEPRRRRTIRSFVKRAGRLTPSQQRALERLWPEWGIDYSDTALDLDSEFGRKAPRVIEIGFGNGDSLVQMAAANPGMDFLGVEVHEPGVGHCLLRLEEMGVTNLRLVKHDAFDVLEHQLLPSSIARVNLYFPDPWPKKRHHKRRIVNDRFLDLVASRSGPGGMLHIATDWENYAEHIDATLDARTDWVLKDRREHDGSEPLDRPPTRFEARGLKLGHRIWDWRYERLP